MPLKIFIAGTDTEIGKTYVSVKLIQAFNQAGYSTLGIKPLASGCKLNNGKLYSDDALALQEAASIKLPYDRINPFTFQPAIAPHIAAAQQKIKLSASELKEKCYVAFNHPADIHIIESVGGWYTPLNDSETMADFAAMMQFSTILVIGIRLGCLNHALLTYKAIKQYKVPLLGWVANCIDPHMIAQEDNINTLRQWLDTPCLGVMPYSRSVELI